MRLVPGLSYQAEVLYPKSVNRVRTRIAVRVSPEPSTLLIEGQLQAQEDTIEFRCPITERALLVQTGDRLLINNRRFALGNVSEDPSTAEVVMIASRTAQG